MKSIKTKYSEVEQKNQKSLPAGEAGKAPDIISKSIINLSAER
ncbi:hypothetical protein [Gramella jeungdoensis]|nr:hypothetical protein [Gramella jeungdoensis]